MMGTRESVEFILETFQRVRREDAMKISIGAEKKIISRAQRNPGPKNLAMV